MIERLSGKPHDELKNVPVNSFATYLLETFFELSSSRTSGMNGNLNSISYGEMMAYSELTGTELEPWEVEIIKQLDRTYIEAVYTAREEDTQ